MSTLYAIGHSTRPFSELVELLQAHRIDLLADVRTIPKSRVNPQFSKESLEQELPKTGIEYRHLKPLGGLRHPDKDSINTAWQNSGFRGYADYMQTREFVHAVRDLMALAKGRRVAIMCAEGNPFRCHRQLLADGLTVRGVRVLHITSRKGAKEHTVTRFAKVHGTRVTYPESSTSRKKKASKNNG